jgi:hypothetical protein
VTAVTAEPPFTAYGRDVARPDDEHPDDRALDRLADRGPSRVGVEGAMRARDVSRQRPVPATAPKATSR